MAGNGASKAKIATKAAAAMPHSQPFFKRARADAVRRMQHDRRHGWLDAVEQPGNHRHITEGA